MCTRYSLRMHLAVSTLLACGFVVSSGLADAQTGATTPKTIYDVAPPQQVPSAEPPKNLREIAPPTGARALTHSEGESTIHILPPPSVIAAQAKALAAPTPLLYHAGGPIMRTATIYAIYWLPKKLQNGSPTSMSPAYQDLQSRHLRDYPAHGIDNNNTQYSETIAGKTTFIENVGRLADTYVDHSPYPASGCNDAQTPGNCLTDAQVQVEIKNVVHHEHWETGLGHIVFLFTSKGEGSCFGATSPVCAYTWYCAYHGFIPGPKPIIYANMPYGDTSVCQLPGTPSPNSDPIADTVITAASHELTEAVTDPLLNAWFTAGGEEIGDLCAYNYGTNTWDSGNANQMWNGHFYELQQEYDNHTNACVQVGP